MMNLDKFKNANFERRTAPVSVPGLAAFFNDGEKPELIVMGLTGEEVAKARERVKQNTDLAAMIEKIVGEKASSKVDAIQQALGISDDVPSDLVYRIAVAEFGIQSVKFEQEDCVKFARVDPTSFYKATSKILELTGLGQVHPGELNSSGTMEE